MNKQMINLAVFGSTGSIGTQTLDVVRKFPRFLSAFGLTAGSNINLLQEQIKEFHPRFAFSPAQDNTSNINSPEALATHPEVDIVVIATSGVSALSILLSAIRAKKVIALSNKESLVSAGEIIMSEVKKYGAEIRPVDSEHSAIWQCLVGEKVLPTRLILTASGGPFRNYTQAELAQVTPEQALHHPSWKMGRKVTVDSATLMNKGLEILEAHYLFGMPFEKIEAVIHPQSIIHSLVEFGDGAMKAQLSQPDMRLPIQYALSYPERWSTETLPRLDLIRTARLEFMPPDVTRFPCLRLAVESGIKGDTYPAVLCAVDEEAVELFLERQIRFPDIARIVEQVLADHRPVPHPDIEDIVEASHWARTAVREVLKKVRLSC